MRTGCLTCVIKHLSQALVVEQEVANGYPQHRYLVIGHLAEAKEELVALEPEISNEIRTLYKRYIDDASINLELNIAEILKRLENKNVGE